MRIADETLTLASAQPGNLLREVMIQTTAELQRDPFALEHVLVLTYLQTRKLVSLLT